MQDKKKIWVGAVVVLLVLGGFGIYKYIQGNVQAQVESSVEQLLKQHGIEHKGVAYNLNENALTIREMALPIKDLPGGVVHVGELFVSEPNLDAFDPTVAGQPPVAKEVIVKNMRGAYKVGGMQSEFTLERMLVLGWKQNLGKVLALQGKGYTQEYMTALLDLTVERVESSNYKEKGTMVVEGESFLTTTSLASTGLTALSSNAIGSYDAEKLHVMLENAEKTKLITLSLAHMKWDGIALPPASYWALVAEMLPQIVDGNLTDEQLATLTQHSGAGTNLFDKTALTLADARLNFQEKDVATESVFFKKLRLTSDVDAEKHTFANLHVALEQFSHALPLLGMSPADVDMFERMLGGEVLMSASFGFDLFADKASSVDISIGAGASSASGSESGGDARATLDFVLPPDLLPFLFGGGDIDAVSEQQLENWGENSTVTALTVSYEDGGLLPKGLAFVSKETGVPAPDMLKGLVPQIVGQARAVLPQLAEANFTALEQCLKNPGTLTIAAKPAPPLKPMEAFMAFIAAPARLNIGVTCAPGKSILEGVQ